MSTSSQVSAREYLRVSLDQSGYGRSVEQQHDENARAAAERGWTLSEPYRDNSVSASRYTQKAREGFGRLMADLEAGRFGAEVLILWESSRGSRRVGEWVDLVEVCAERGVRIFVTTHGRSYDARNSRDRRSLLEDAVDSEYESSKISERIKRDNAASAAKGRPHGRVPYGYRRVYDSDTGKLLGQEPHPTEAPIVAELFARVAAGQSLRSIARDFEARGVERRSGGSFSSEHFRSMLLSVGYIGQRVHDPDRDPANRRRMTANARVAPATWAPIVPEADYLAVQSILSDPARVTTRPGRGKHLLSMIARCAECDAPLAATTRRNGRTVPARMYQCHHKGCVRIDADELDVIAANAIVDFVAKRQYDALPTGADEDGAQEAREEAARLRSRLDELADAVASGELSATLAGRSEAKIEKALREADARVRELSTPSRLRWLAEPSEDAPEADVVTRWHSAEMASKREAARMLFVDGAVGPLRVQRRPEGRRGGRHVMPAAERIEPTGAWEIYAAI